MQHYHYPYDSYLNESILDDISSDDINKKTSVEKAAELTTVSIKTVRITFSFEISKYDLTNPKPYEQLFRVIVAQFEESGFVRSFSVANESWDDYIKKDRTFTLNNHSTDTDSDYSNFLDQTYRKSLESGYTSVTIMNRFDIEPTEKPYPFKKFCREIQRWYKIFSNGKNGLYDSLSVFLIRIDKADIFTILFKGTSLYLNQRDLEQAYRKIWPNDSKKSLMYSDDFNKTFGAKETFEFRRFLKYLHDHPNIFKGVDILVRGDGTWETEIKKSSDDQYLEWRIFLKFNDVRDGALHTTDDAINFVREKIYGHFGPGDAHMLMKQIKMNHIFNLWVRFFISVPLKWKENKESTLFCDYDTIDIPEKMRFYHGPSEIVVNFTIMSVNPDVYGAEVVVDENGNWTDNHISWFALGKVLNNFMASGDRFTELK